jgi:hypothetical protein
MIFVRRIKAIRKPNGKRLVWVNTGRFELVFVEVIAVLEIISVCLRITKQKEIFLLEFNIFNQSFR